MKNYFIYTIKEKIKQCCKIVQTYLKTLFLKIFKNYPVLQTERFVGAKFKKLIERLFLTILLNKRIYYMNDFIERSFSEKTNEMYWKWMIILRTNKINYLTIEKKRTKGAVYERWTNKMQWIRQCPSLSRVIILPFSLDTSLKLRAYTE